MSTPQQLAARRMMRDHLHDHGITRVTDNLADAMIQLFIGLERNK